MKKNLSLLLLFALTGASALMAKHVTAERASEIATKYVSSQVHAPAGLKATSVETINGNLYLVHFAPKGFALVSSDDNADPIIGYSTESNIKSNLMPDNMAYMLSEASMGVEALAKSGQSTSMRWQQIEQGMMSRAGEPVEPLISVNWNQTSPYNKYCPGRDNTKAIVGCVAVAMAQAMSVQQYPLKPMGNVIYGSANYGQLTIDFDKEEPYDWKAILNGSNSYDEAARLMYHTGMSVHMNYGTDGSGIPSNQVYRITNALRDNFGYPDVQYYQRTSYRGDWEQLLLNELAAGRALVYNAIDSQGGYGHSFNIDGYNGTLYHLNWGWGGYGNGYFSINSLKDAQMNMNYDSYHYAVTGIGAANSPLRNIQLSDLVVEEDTPVGSAVSAVLINDELPTADMTVVITGEYQAVDGTYKAIPFTYKNGIIYTNRAISASEGNIYVRVQAKVKVDGKDRNLVQGYNIEITAPQPIEKRTSLSYDRQTKTFSLHSKFGTICTVKNAQGTVVVTGKIEETPNIEFNRSMLTPGKNTIEVSNNGKSKVINLTL